jgi:hypothetical protein
MAMVSLAHYPKILLQQNHNLSGALGVEFLLE